MKFLVMWAFLFFSAVAAQAQEAPTMTEQENLSIQVQLRDGVILQQQKTIDDLKAQLGAIHYKATFEAWQTNLSAQIGEIKKAHGWGDDVVWDPTTAQFFRKADPKVKPALTGGK